MTELDLWSSWWIQSLDASGLSDRLIFVIGNCMLIWIWFWPVNIFLYFAYKYKFIPRRFYSQPDAVVDTELVKRNLKENLFSHVFVVPVMSYFMFDVFMHFGMSIRAPLPSWSIVLRDTCVAIFFADMLGYCLHRSLHHKAIYKYVHKKHHEYKVNVGVASTYAHPVEEISTNVVAVFGNMLMGSHILVLWLWLSIRLLEAIWSHSGFHFLPYSISFLFTGGDFHEFHHSHNTGNFGQFFTFWDWILGTDVAYYKLLKEHGKYTTKTMKAKE
jgi:sterol desaturase/sphingolipid hydroxylase (fatty acid hydroxylase superfamily)